MLLGERAERCMPFQGKRNAWIVFVICFVLPTCMPISNAPLNGPGPSGKLGKIEGQRTFGDEVLSNDELHVTILGQGREVYLRNCRVCHGDRGDGKGEYARVLRTKPRDFTAGTYKFRSTQTGALPTDADLMRTLLRGIPKSGMPSFSGLDEEERLAVIVYIKSLSPRFATSQIEEPILIPPMPAKSLKSIRKGSELYGKMGCAACHGNSGNGRGPVALELLDDSGAQSLPADLTDSSWKGGCKGRDLYRTIMTGLDGSPMPSFGEQLEPDEAWALVHYIQSLPREGILFEAPGLRPPEHVLNPLTLQTDSGQNPR